ncbi:MAG: ammonium transporter [Spirochaeta sp.]
MTIDLTVELIDTLWVITAATLVFFMQAGFSFLESGLTRSKNSINVAIKNLTDLGVSILCYWLFGFALMFGVSRLGILGSSEFFFAADGKMWAAAFFLFQAMFCSTAATIVSGAVAERMRYISYIASTVLLAAFIYPVLGHWVWGGAFLGGNGGWLESMGFMDFAGSTVVHSTGGWISLAALRIIGPRTGRFDEPGRKIPGSNIPMAVVGVMILWFGWFGFNGGSTLGLTSNVPQILVNTAIAAAAGMVVSLAIGWPVMGYPDVGLVLNGSLAGLVAITANAPFVNEWQSVIIGGIGAIVMLAAVAGLERLRIDDAVGAIPVHLAAGIWGTLAVALFGSRELLGTGLSMMEQLGVQALGIIAVGGWAFGVPYGILWWLNRYVPLRVTPEQEATGLNVAEHGATTEAYDLFNVMEKHQRSGDLSLRVPVEPFTEVGAIARQYNAVLDSLDENVVAKSEYLVILDNVKDGLFLIDEDMRIAPSYSRPVESLLGVSQPAGQSLLSILSSLLPEQKLRSVREFLALCFSDTVDHRTVLKLNPLQQEEFFFDHGDGIIASKHLQWSFTRITGALNGRMRLMVLVRDVTTQVELGEKMEQQQRENTGEMELLYRILHIEPGMLREFIQGVEQNIRRINEELESGTAGRKLDHLFALAHRIKGDAALLGLDFIAERAHDLEDEFDALRKRKSVKNEDFLPLAITMSRLSSMAGKARAVTQRLSNFQRSFASQDETDSGYLQASLQKTVERITRDTGKSAGLEMDIHSQLIPDHLRRSLRDALIQLVRNAVVHGIEDPETRISAGKPPQGTILVRMVREQIAENGILAVTIRDDGAGLDLARLKQRALETGRFPEQVVASWSTAEVARLIFTGGISTSGAVDLHSGRGIGMAVVGSVVQEHRGRISVVYQTGNYTEFTLRFPLSGSEQADNLPENPVVEQLVPEPIHV